MSLATIGAPSTTTNGGGDPLVKALQQAEAFIGGLGQPSSGSQGSTIESVTVTLSAKAQQLIDGQRTSLSANDATNDASAPTYIDLATRLQQALDDPQNPAASALRGLKQLNEQIRQSAHGAAGQRLQQLLKQFSILRLFNGSLSPRQLAELAKEIADAAQELASSESEPTTDATGQSAGSTTDASSASTSLSSNDSSTTNVTGDSVEAVTPAIPSAAQVAAPGGASPVVSSSAAGTPSTSDQGNAPATAASTPNISAADTPAANTNQRQALLDEIEAQGAKGLAEVQGKIADQSLLQQAANAVSAIQGLIKQAEEKEQHKHKGAPDAESDQATKAAEQAGEVIAKAQADIIGSSVSSSDAAPAVTSLAGAPVNLFA